MTHNITNLKSNENCLITNYKPENNRKKTNKDIEIFVNKNETNSKGNISDFHTSVITSIANLDGDKDVLERKDLNKLKNLKTKYNIKNILTDLTSGVARIIFGDNTQIRVDFNAKENTNLKGRNHLEYQIINKEAHLDKKGLLSGIKNFDSSALTNDYIYVNVAKGTTMAEVKEKYNLPDGSLTNYVTSNRHAPGNRDNCTVDGDKVWFTAEDFAKGNNMSLDEVIQLFNN